MPCSKRDRIVQAAYEAFLAFGVKKTTLDDIARRVGLNPASLYYYFRSKGDLFEAVIDRELGHVVSVRERALEGKEDPVEQLRAFVLSIASFFEQLETLSSAEIENLRESIWEADGFIQPYMEKDIQMLEAFLREGKCRGLLSAEDPRGLAEDIQAAMRGISLRIIDTGRLREARLRFVRFADVMIRGLASTPER